VTVTASIHTVWFIQYNNVVTEFAVASIAHKIVSYYALLDSAGGDHVKAIVVLQ
jgi:hypothetical protein